MDFTLFTPEAQVAVVEHAARFAKRLNHELVGADDLILGLTVPVNNEYASSVERIILTNFQVPRIRFYEAVKSITLRPLIGAEGNRVYMPGAKKALEDALALAKKRGANGKVTRPDIVVSLVDGGDAIFMRVLEIVGIDATQLKHVMMHDISSLAFRR